MISWITHQMSILRHSQAIRLFISSELKKSTFPTLLEETLNCKFEEPKPIAGIDAKKYGQHDSSVNEANNKYRESLGGDPLEKWYGCTTPNPDSHNPHFLDYLGLCIWDGRRQEALGIGPLCKKYTARYSRHPTNAEFNTTNTVVLWGDLFLHEVFRLPGGQLRKAVKVLPPETRARFGILEQ